MKRRMCVPSQDGWYTKVSSNHLTVNMKKYYNICVLTNSSLAYNILEKIKQRGVNMASQLCFHLFFFIRKLPASGRKWIVLHYLFILIRWGGNLISSHNFHKFAKVCSVTIQYHTYYIKKTQCIRRSSSYSDVNSYSIPHWVMVMLIPPESLQCPSD